MKKSATLLAALAVAFAADGATVRTATEDFVTNRIAVAVEGLSTNLAAVATSGKYSDLSGKPTNVSSFNNDAGYLIGEIDPTVDLVSMSDGSKQLSVGFSSAIIKAISFSHWQGNGWTRININDEWVKIPQTASEVGATTPEDVTAAIREQSLGGIWDAELEVWWTPVMRNGSLTYQATTNVNLNAEN